MALRHVTGFSAALRDTCASRPTDPFHSTMREAAGRLLGQPAVGRCLIVKPVAERTRPSLGRSRKVTKASVRSRQWRRTAVSEEAEKGSSMLVAETCDAHTSSSPGETATAAEQGRSQPGRVTKDVVALQALDAYFEKLKGPGV